MLNGEDEEERLAGVPGGEAGFLRDKHQEKERDSQSGSTPNYLILTKM